MNVAKKLYPDILSIKGLSILEYNEIIHKCRDILLHGGVISMPTDTIYGIACSAQNIKAVQRLYNVKQRNILKPIAICVADIDQIYKYAEVNVDKCMLNELLPGPYTLLFNRKSNLNPDLNPYKSNVGIRIPKDDFLYNLTKSLSSGPIALTSANLSNEPNSLEIKDFKNIWTNLDLIIDGGKIDNKEAQGSTIIDLTNLNHYKITRKGSGLEKCIKILNKYNLQDLI
ncbi:threonylcarbamoyl-AMP synthase-like [Gordionus sp. m RMFG-2023]|uniref:threonylcarbamoyl-AMP synthase-like n=1 Tax=Gordionus sp. m RMFG-2023 TaxID=3053472 RepID=UPI0031FC0CBE